MMYLRIFHRHVYLLLLVLTLLVCFGVGTSYGNANALAEKVYTNHRTVLERNDVQDALPAILEQLATPVVQKLLTPASIPLVANNPELLKPAVPDASPEFITSMKEDAALQQLLQDADFQKLMQNPVAIDALVAFITGEMEPKESWVVFRGTGYPANINRESVSLVFNLESGRKYLAGSQHTLILTLTSRRTGKPFPSVRFTLKDPSESTTKATFSPATITTDKNGKAETQITVGDRDFRVETNAFVLMEPYVAPWVFFLGLGYPENVDGERFSLVSNLKLDTEYLPGSQHTLILTLTNERTGKPVPSVPLTLYPTTDVTVSPATITTDKNGKAETQITVGDRDFSFNVDIPAKGPTFGNYDFSSLFMDGEVLDLQLDGLVSQRQYHQRSKHKVTFTVRKQRTREPVPFVRLSLDSSEYGSTLFAPSVITTGKNGKAETYITFPRAPGSVVINISVHMEHEKRVTYKRQHFYHFNLARQRVVDSIPRPIYEGERVHVDHDLRTNVAYRTGSKRKVIFTVRTQKSNKPVPSARLTLSAHSESTTTATFSPAVITTDKNGKAETQITFGEKPGSISIEMNIEIDYEATQVVLRGIGLYSGNVESVDVGEVGLETNFSSRRVFIPGSQHKLILTLTDKRTGKPVPSAGISFSFRKQSTTTTATFSPAIIITDKNGKAETQITFGEKPGSIFILVESRTSQRKAIFNVNTPRISGGAGIEIDVMHDKFIGRVDREHLATAGIEVIHDDSRLGKLSEFSYEFGFTKIRKKLLVRTRSAKHPHMIPYVDLVFKSVGSNYGIATFEPKQVRTDEYGQAVTYITFPRGLKDFQIAVEVNMVLVQVNLNEANNLIPIPFVNPPDRTGTAEVVRGVNGMTDLRFYARDQEIPSLSLDSVGAVTSLGAFPLNASAHFQFEARLDETPAKSPLFFISSRTNTDTKLNRDYATGNRDGRVTVRMNTGSETGSVVLNLNPPNSAQLKCTISVLASESRFDTIVDFNKDLNLDPLTIVSEEKFKYRYEGIAKFWNRPRKRPQDIVEAIEEALGFRVNGTRVEVYIKSRKISSTGVEIGAYAKLYEGLTPDTDDLDDVDVRIFTLSWDDPLTKGLTLHKGQDNDADPLTLKGPNTTEAARVLGLSHLWEKITFDKQHRLYFVDVSLSLEAVPIYNGNLITVFDAPATVTVDFGAPAAITANRFSLSDVNADGQVNLTDLILVSNAIGQIGMEIRHLDVNGDGTVSIVDLMQVTQHLTQLTNPGAAAHDILPSGVTYETIQGWIDRARIADDGTAVFRQGLAKLEYLLTLIIPEQTALLANYPNPFNPETWVPYHLAKPAEVTLTIYSTDGKVVRHLDLGHQAAGIYQSKSRAAYWDGRNNVGERVASGIYFYTLTAGEFAATKKMLILK